MTRTVAAIVLGVVLLPATPLSFAGGSDPGPAVAGGGEGAGWVAVNVTLDGSPVTLSYHAEGVEEPFIRGKGVYGPYHDLYWHLTTSEGLPGGPTIHGDVDAVDGDGTLFHEEVNTTSDVVEYELTPRYETGTLNLFMWLAGDATNWSYHLEGENVIVNGVTSGSDTFLYAPEDFRSPANVQVAPVAGARLDAVKTVSSQTSLIGIFSGSFAQETHTEFHADTPGGEEACTCSWVHFQGSWAPGPGEYAFHATGASVLSYYAAGVRGAHLPS